MLIALRKSLKPADSKMIAKISSGNRENRFRITNSENCLSRLEIVDWTVLERERRARWTSRTSSRCRLRFAIFRPSDARDCSAFSLIAIQDGFISKISLTGQKRTYGRPAMCFDTPPSHSAISFPNPNDSDGICDETLSILFLSSRMAIFPVSS